MDAPTALTVDANACLLLIALVLVGWGCAPKVTKDVETPSVPPPYTVETIKGDVIPDVEPRS